MSRRTSKRYPVELGERAVRMVVEIRDEQGSEWAAMTRVAELLGVGTPQTVSEWGRGALTITALALPPLLEDPRTRPVAIVLVALVVATRVLAARRPAPTRQLLGGVARARAGAGVVPAPSGGAGAARLRGVGRFAAVRDAPPRKLL